MKKHLTLCLPLPLRSLSTIFPMSGNTLLDRRWRGHLQAGYFRLFSYCISNGYSRELTCRNIFTDFSTLPLGTFKDASFFISLSMMLIIACIICFTLFFFYNRFPSKHPVTKILLNYLKLILLPEPQVLLWKGLRLLPGGELCREETKFNKTTKKQQKQPGKRRALTFSHRILHQSSPILKYSAKYHLTGTFACLFLSPTTMTEITAEGNASTTTTVIDNKNGSVPKSPGKILKRTVTEDIVTTFSSPAAWLLVIALIITWSAVAVVMFDLVDYKNFSASSISKIGSDPIKFVHHAVEETTDWVYGFFSLLSDIISSDEEDDDDGDEDTDKVTQREKEKDKIKEKEKPEKKEEKKAKTKEKTEEKTKKEVKSGKQEKVKQMTAKVKEVQKTSSKPKEKDEKETAAVSKHEQKAATPQGTITRQQLNAIHHRSQRVMKERNEQQPGKAPETKQETIKVAAQAAAKKDEKKEDPQVKKEKPEEKFEDVPASKKAKEAEDVSSTKKQKSPISFFQCVYLDGYNGYGFQFPVTPAQRPGEGSSPPGSPGQKQQGQ
ncbi:Triadin [Pteropus alecto]|uniref:Triadin n=1 Tax=Pteropus alecto TaxID=9402 RepID=L5JMQ6_PTEAL|nr:Triadin [Pteropus alecto]